MTSSTISAVTPAVKRDVRDVRPLLPRTGQYVVPVMLLAASIGSQIVDEQREHYVRETVAWAMARFNVTPVSGGRPSKSVTGIAVEVETHIIRAVGNGEITHKVAIDAVHRELAPVYGHQARVQGWVPGFKTATGGKVLEITDDPCPRCTTNPIGFKVGDAKTARCLNSEDCGWTSN